MIAPFVLASASPRRRDLLLQAGFEFEVDPADIDEVPRAGEDGTTLACRLASEKALAVSSRHTESTLVLAADTVVVVDGEAWGKPVDAEDARRMLGILSGRAHEVVTGFCWRRGPRAHVAAVRTEVRFRALRTADIDRYVATGEPLDKAGAYGIQGRAAGLVRSLRGSYTNVVGLPVAEVLDALSHFEDESKLGEPDLGA